MRKGVMISRKEYGQRIASLLPRAGGFARSILRSRDDAEDAVQQAALRGLEGLVRYDESRSFEAWWFAILRNCCMDLLRGRPDRPVLDIGQMDAAQGQVPSAWEDLAEALDRMEQHHAEILRLKYFAGMSYRELAEMLDIPQGTVMSRLYEARRKLAEQMRIES